MFEQQTLTARRDAEIKILLCLHQLWQQDAPDPPPLGQYFRQWPTVQDVPGEKLAFVTAALEEEKLCRKLKGDARYYRTLTIAEKIAEYEYALQALRYELYGDDGSQLDNGVTQREFKRMVAASVAKYYETKEHAYLEGAGEAEPFEPYAYLEELEREDANK
ncbi:MAG: hypothetical protein ACK5JF_02665 [Oscillospiraceae bacterium]